MPETMAKGTHVQGRRQLLRSVCVCVCVCVCGGGGGGGGGLSLYRAAGSNLHMVRPSLRLVVKLLIIRTREARGKILDLASYLVFW